MLGLGIFFCVLLGAVASGADALVPAAPSEQEAVPVPADASSVPVAAAETRPDFADPVEAEAPHDVQAVGAARGVSEPAEAVENREVAMRASVAMTFWRMGQMETAERAFADALSLAGPPEEKRSVILTMAQLYREAGASVKEISVLESFLRTFPQDAEVPSTIMRLGILYRESGAYDAATTRFYQVLNSTLRGSSEGFDANRRLAMKARLEIADTYLLRGSFSEARTYYSRLELLALDPSDRERVKYRAAQLQYALEQWQAAEGELAAFVLAYPESAFVPEARYMRARSLKELQRRDDAVQEVLTLLRSQDSPDPAAAQTIAYWKRRTGNELANNFYEQGDFLGALAIYQALARASADMAWRWPAIYQVGLCFERLGLPNRAAEAYRVIVQPDPAVAADVVLPDALTSLQSMAQWRLGHLDWVEGFGQRLQALSAGDPADA